MKAFGKFELKLMEVKVTVADEIGIYFVGETGERGLALAYNSPKKAISSVKKLKKVLDVEYNIEKDIVERSLKEKKEVIQTEEVKEETKVVGSKLSCFGHKPSSQGGYIDECLSNGKTVDEILTSWNVSHEKKMGPKRVEGHIKHLVAEHGFDEAKARELLKEKK